MPKDNEKPNKKQRSETTTPASEDTKPDAQIIDFLSTPTFRAKDDGQPVDPLTRTRIEVTLDQLRPSEVNPRTSRNPKYEDIKTSILTRGLDHPPNITRVNPTDGFYTIKDGGNTRLEILRELWDDTQAPRFYRIECTYVPYEGEFDEVVGHLVENDMRGGMLFIEKALAAVKLCKMIKTETGEDVSMRKLAGLITKRGWTLYHPDLSRYEYAVNTLLPAIPTLLWSGAGHKQVRILRKLETDYRNYWKTQTRSTVQASFDAVFTAVLGDNDDEILDYKSLRHSLECGLGAALGIEQQTVATECDAVARGIPLNGAAPTVAPIPDALVNLNTPAPKDADEAPATRTPGDAAPQPPAPAAGKTQTPPTATPASINGLRQQCYQIALTLAGGWGFDELIDQWDDGVGFRITAPDRPLNYHTPQGGLYLQLYKLSVSGALICQQEGMGLDLKPMLSTAFPDSRAASFAELFWTTKVTLPGLAPNGDAAAAIAALQTGYRTLEDTAQRLAARLLEEYHAA